MAIGRRVTGTGLEDATLVRDYAADREAAIRQKIAQVEAAGGDTAHLKQVLGKNPADAVGVAQSVEVEKAVVSPVPAVEHQLPDQGPKRDHHAPPDVELTQTVLGGTVDNQDKVSLVHDKNADVTTATDTEAHAEPKDPKSDEDDPPEEAEAKAEEAAATAKAEQQQPSRPHPQRPQRKPQGR